MSSEKRVFSHVGCLSLSGFDEISEAVFEAVKSLTRKVEEEGKRLQNVYIFLGLTAGNQNVREYVCKSQCKRVSSWKTRVYIDNPCHAVGSK